MCMGTREGRGEETFKEGQLARSQEASRGTSGSQSCRLRNCIFQGMENQINLQSCESLNKVPKTDTINHKANTWMCKETNTHLTLGVWRGASTFLHGFWSLPKRCFGEHGSKARVHKMTRMDSNGRWGHALIAK